jgi:hypothetical protein
LFALFLIALLNLSFVERSDSQMENVPVSNQVYEFLDRMAVKGVLPLYSNAMIPVSRRDVASLLTTIGSRQDQLSGAQIDFLHKFQQEFVHEMNPADERPAVLFKDGTNGIFSDTEKYLYMHSDSTASLYLEFIGSLEHRRISGDSYGSSYASFEQHGGRVRGTIKGRLGFFLQATNGTLYGDKTFALSDPRLRGNVKFNELNSAYFDFSEAYLHADLSWFSLEFGREYTLVGTGYSDRLMLSENASLMDLLKIDAQYKTIRFLFLHGSLLADKPAFDGLAVTEPSNSNKYFALHRVQFSLWEKLNLGVSEMTIYQRYTPEFAYLNPIIFYKSVEHSLRDRDNSFLNLDFELFPFKNYKIYGTWLIDDIDVSKIGTGWWGNEFGWQGGLYAAEVAGISNLDAIVEYARIEPYVYSNRVAGNDYSHNNFGLGHHLEPNSDEWFVQLNYRPAMSLRAWLSWYRERHGENTYDAGGQIVRNVGGNLLQGHRNVDSDVATFLDGNLVQQNRLQLRATYEPITNIFVSGAYEFRTVDNQATSSQSTDHYGAVRMWVEW